MSFLHTHSQMGGASVGTASGVRLSPARGGVPSGINNPSPNASQLLTLDLPHASSSGQLAQLGALALPTRSVGQQFCSLDGSMGGMGGSTGEDPLTVRRTC